MDLCSRAECLKPNRAKLRRIWPLVLIVGVLLIAGLAWIHLLLNHHQWGMGFFPGETQIADVWYVFPSTPPWCRTFHAFGVSLGDRIIAVDAQAYHARTQEEIARAAELGKRTIDLLIERRGSRLTLSVGLTRFTLADVLDVKILDLIIGFCYWLLALAVYRARPESAANRAFGITGALMANCWWLVGIDAMTPHGILTLLLTMTWLAGICCCAASAFHFTAVFPFVATGVVNRVLVGLRWGTLLSAAAYPVALFLVSRHDSVTARHFRTMCNWLMLGFGSLAFGGFGLRTFWLACRRRLPRRILRQVWIQSAGLALLAPAFVVELTRPFVGHGWFWFGLDGRLAVLPPALCLAIAILRYHSFRSLPRSIAVVLILGMSAVLAGLGTWILRLTAPDTMDHLGGAPFVSLLIATLAAGLIWSLQTSCSWGFRRLLHWDRCSHSAVRQFGQEVMARFDLAHPDESVAAALVANLELERAVVWRWDRRRGVLALAAWAGEWSTPPPATPPPTLIRGEAGKAPLRTIEGEPFAGLTDHAQPCAVEVIAPLWASGSPVGALGLGKRWDDEVFDERDMEVVDIIAQQSALLLLTASHIERVRRFPCEIAEAQERERLKIAQELHDTIQQFLGRLPFLLEVSRKSARTRPEETEAILEHCLVEVEGAAETVRELRNNLAPRHLEQGLSRPLELLIEKFRARTALCTETRISNDVDAALSLEARHALYRVIQQALDNAAAHARASQVSVAVRIDGNQVVFSVVDDGRGFSEEDRRRAEERGSFGLRSMDARITSLQGGLAFEPGDPSGTRISGWLPVEPQLRNAG